MGNLTDKSWQLLEVVKIDTFFDDKNIPPLIFPVALILILLALFFLFILGGASSEPTEVCGDGICSTNETTSSCSKDCPFPEPTGNRVTIQLNKDPTCQITVKLYDSGAKLLGTQRGTKNAFVFNGIDSENAYVNVESPYGKSQKSPTSTISDDATFNLILDEDICEQPKNAMGVLRLNVRDSSTASPLNGVSISIAETSGGQILSYAVSGQIINGEQDFTLPYDNTYTIYATKEGYISGSETTNVKEGRPTSQVLSLVPEEPDGPTTGELEVCVRNGTELITSGSVSVESLAGDYFQSGDLANAGSTPSPTLSGCYVFTDIPAGSSVIASMANPPSDCIPAATETIQILAGSQSITNIGLECGPELGGYLKISVIGDDGIILTENATITVWAGDDQIIPGTGFTNSLSRGSDGYTEEIEVPTDGSVYVWVRGLPFGYLDYQSELIIIEQDEHREFVIDLDYSEDSGTTPTEGFIFDGVSYPAHVLVNTSFEITINEILYTGLPLNNQNSRLKVYAGNEICDVVYDGIWNAYCISPEETGNHNITIIAKHNGLSETFDGEFEVREYGLGAGMVRIVPISSTHGEPPLTIYYQITVNDEDVINIPEQKLRIEYIDSPDAYPGEVSELLLSDDGTWYLVADVPYFGDYMIDMQLYILHEGIYYNTTYSLYFTATEHSESLVAHLYIPHTTISTSESFTTQVNLNFKNEVAYGLEVFEVHMDRVFYTLEWDEGEQLYEIQMSSSDTEKCKEPLTFIINNKEIEESETLHIIDISKTKAGTCPLQRGASCDSIEEIRKCFYDHNSETAFYTSDQLIACIASGCPSYLIQSCPSNNKGDLDLDCRLTGTDVTLFKEYLNAISSVSDRNRLTNCLDMDNDGDVDEEDVNCMTNMVSTKWHGDIVAATTGDSCLSDNMKGGFCFNIDTDSPLPGDIYSDSILDINDENVLSDIISATSEGVTPDQDMLDITDFNQDGRIDSTDLDCLRNFYAVDFSDGAVTPGSGNIPSECFNIFNMNCIGTRADLNADGSLSAMDLIILRFLVAGRLSSAGLFTCADVDESGSLDQYDVECFESYFEGTELWASCMDCEADLPIDAYSNMEICNDGYDNDCDGLRDDGDPRCNCGSNTPCEMKWDTDIVLGVNDDNYKICFNDGSGYGWMLSEEINESCDDADEWENIGMCGDTQQTCVFYYPSSFSYPDTASNGSFAWLTGSGNIGPIGVTKDCDEGGHPGCANGWNEITTSGGCGGNFATTGAVPALDQECKECGDEGEKWGEGKTYRCSFCRFKYDFCQEINCEASGSQLIVDISDEHSSCAGTTGHYDYHKWIFCASDEETETYNGPAYEWCSRGWDNTYTEVCSSRGVCMGTYTSTE